MTGNKRSNLQVGSTLKGESDPWNTEVKKPSQKMLWGLNLAILLLFATWSAHAAGRACLCSGLRPAGLLVNCSSMNLQEVPRPPSDATELHVKDNRITSVPPGLFDRLHGLKKVSLSGNPFHCDCTVRYLRDWLLRNKAIVSEEPTCASPASVAHKAISELGEDFFSSCASCMDGTLIVVMEVILCCIILLLLWNLRLARTCAFTLYIDERHAGLEAYPLRSLKPKHRKRLHTEYGPGSVSLAAEEDVDKPLLNMELLPQVLDVLHKKHNIKIKAT